MTEVTVTTPEEPGEPRATPPTLATTVAEVVARPEPTPLSALRLRRKELVENLHIDLRVPRWGDPDDPDFAHTPALYVRYRPASQTQLQEFMDRRAPKNAETKVKDPKWTLHVNADILVNCCVGVFAVLDGDTSKKYSLKLDPEGNPVDRWTRFDPDLAKALELDPDVAQAADVAEALYVTEGDLVEAANALYTWSTQSSEQLQEDFPKP